MSKIYQHIKDTKYEEIGIPCRTMKEAKKIISKWFKIWRTQNEKEQHR